MPLGGPDPIVGAYQGVWPGIQVLDNGAAKAAPSGSPWIDTNTGFIRSVRAWGPASVWLGYLPPVHSVITGERYQAAIADAEMWPCVGQQRRSTQYGASTWGNTEEEAFKHIHEVVRMISPSREPARRRRGAAGHTGCGDRVTWQSSMAA